MVSNEISVARIEYYNPCYALVKYSHNVAWKNMFYFRLCETYCCNNILKFIELNEECCSIYKLFIIRLTNFVKKRTFFVFFIFTLFTEFLLSC